ncbi:MAG: ABC transporter permease, partial [Marinoscillum sp.]
GVLKSLGSTNQLLRRIFFFNGVNLIVRGVFWGNLAALLFCYLQMEFKMIPLDPANYYMSHVPIKFDMMAVLGINFFVVMITAIALFIPLTVISRIRPIKAIRFD